MNYPMQYSLEVKQLIEPYGPDCDLKACIPLMSIGSDSPFGAISVGDSITDGPAISYLGVVAHVNHMIGPMGDDTCMHLTRVYLNPDD
jgi:hypothetical protein